MGVLFANRVKATLQSAALAGDGTLTLVSAASLPAIALVMKPALLLADEPTGDLDETTADSLHQLLRDMHREYGLTSIIATHNPRLAAACDRVLRLELGQLKAA